jgi:PAS domain S-box-containing protein
MWQRVLFRLRGGTRLSGCDDEEAARQFHLELCAFVIWTGLMGLAVLPAFSRQKIASEGIMLLFTGVTLTAIILLRQGSKRSAAKLFLLTVWCTISGLSLVASPVRGGGQSLAWAIVLILNAGWLLGRPFALGLTVATLAVTSLRDIALQAGFPLPILFYPGAPAAVWGTELAAILLGIGPLLAILDNQRHQVSALRESEERFRSLSNASFEGILIQDQRGVILDANLAFARLFGYGDQDELFGKNVAELAPLDSGGQSAGGLRELTGVRRDGRTFPAEIESHPIKYRGEDATLVAYRDLTERKCAEEERARLQAELFQSQKMESIGRLAGGVAHDFNNLLTVINGYSQMALDTLREDDPLYVPLSEIRKAGERSAGLSKQLLAFGRKQVLLPRIVDLNVVVREMRPMLERLVGEDVELAFALNAGKATVHADPAQLDQVILNLTVNARDAMPQGGRLLIETTETEEPAAYVILSASDTGTGMDEATRQRIFEPFFTTKESGKGTGLGLAMVQGIVAQSGGQIEVRSQLGEGTTILIYLPRVDQTGVDVEKMTVVPAAGGRETVLVVEDQAEVRNYAVEVLRAQGYHVVQAEGPTEVLRLCQEEQVHLVVTDVVMPLVSGRELAEHLGELWPEIKVLFMSGYTNDVMLNHGISDREIPFIQKPFSPEELAGSVRALLGNAKNSTLTAAG